MFCDPEARMAKPNYSIILLNCLPIFFKRGHIIGMKLQFHIRLSERKLTRNFFTRAINLSAGSTTIEK